MVALNEYMKEERKEKLEQERQKPIIQQVQEHTSSPIVKQVQAQTSPAPKPQPSFFSKLIPAGKLVFSRLGEAGHKIGAGLEMGNQKAESMMGQSQPQSMAQPRMQQARPQPQMRSMASPQASPSFDIESIERNALSGGMGNVSQPEPSVMRVKKQLKMKQPRQMIPMAQPQGFDMDGFEKNLMGGGGLFGSGSRQPRQRPKAKSMGQGFDMGSFEKSLMGAGDMLGGMRQAVRKKIRRHHATRKRRRR